MREQISSSMTLSYKVTLPICGIAGFAAATTAFFISDSSDSHFMRWIFLAFTVVGATIMYKTHIVLKQVVLNGEELEISNFRRTIVVHLSDVEEVSENRWVNTHPITLRFRRETPFGRTVVFMPKMGLAAFMASHPVVDKLRDAAARAPKA